MINMVCTLRLTFLVVFLLFISGCATVKNYDVSDNDIGFEHYAAKYFLLFIPGANGAMEVTTLTLPDLSRPRFIKRKAGWGTLQFSFKVQNGVLTEFGTTQDSTGAQTLTTLGTLGTAYGSLLGAKSTAAGVIGAATITASAGGAAMGGAPTLTIDTLNTSAGNIQNDVIAVLAGLGKPELNNTIARITNEQAKLAGASQLNSGNEVMSEIAKAQATTRAIVKELKKEEQNLGSIIDGIEDLVVRAAVSDGLFALSTEIGVLSSFATSEDQPAMYEIVPVKDGVIFQKVAL